MDGVLIDSEPIHMACEREMFSLLGISVSQEEHHSMIGSTDEAMWSRIGSKNKISKQLPELIKLKKELYFEYLKHNNKLEPIPYIPELIDDLLKNDFSCLKDRQAYSIFYIFLLKIKAQPFKYGHRQRRWFY